MILVNILLGKKVATSMKDLIMKPNGMDGNGTNSQLQQPDQKKSLT
jgi:hypothetical protein